MKRFCQIFALYLLALACYPCTGSGSGVERIPDKTILSVNNADDCTEHDPCKKSCNDDCNGPCNPLCQCFSCGCASLTAKLLALQVKTPASEGSSSLFSYQAPFSTAYHSALFHPPKAHLG